MYTPGVVSRQLLNPDKSNSKRVTITEVHLEVNACQPRHTHEASEQIWYATKGRGKLLIANNEEKEFCAGDVVRFAINLEVYGSKLVFDILFVIFFQDYVQKFIFYISHVKLSLHYGQIINFQNPSVITFCITVTFKKTNFQTVIKNLTG